MVGALAMTSSAVASLTEPPTPKPTIVLVHGAFAESSSWDSVVPLLLAQGYPVVAAAVPLRGVKSDSDYLASLIHSIDGPIVLVGHSYGGVVITNAGTGNSHVRALVYVAGLAPDTGETSAQLAALYPGSTLGPTLAPPVSLPDGTKDLYIKQQDFPQQFAGDLPLAQAQRMAVTQRPITQSAFQEPSGVPAWKTIPSWFIFGSLDKNIPAQVHSFMATRAGAAEIVSIQDASHVVMISHPDAVARVINHAAGGSDASPDARQDAAANPGFAPAPVIPMVAEPPARLVVDAPLPEPLTRGYVVIRYRAEHARILPVYGPSALGVSPRIGHLHVTVDDASWHWLDSSDQPLSINGLSPGPHKLLLELEDTTHRVMDSAVVNFVIPPSPVAKP